MSQPDALPGVVYIAGYGRSGSTLLDTLLGNHPLMFGAGELASVFDAWPQKGRCSCGQAYPDCAFWPRVLDRLQTALPETRSLTMEQLEAATRQIEAARSPWSSASPEAREGYARLWQAFLAAIAQESGRGLIVDSSKSSRLATHRIWGLAELCGLDVKILHLVRDPRALMWSALRGSNRLLEAGRPANLMGGVYRALIGWSLANSSVQRTHTRLPHLPYLQLRYEDLAGRPIESLHRLSAFLGVSLDPVIEAVSAQRQFDPGHGVGGNRMRRQGPIRIVVDEERKGALPAYARVIASLSWPLASRYGYDVLR